MRISHVGLLVAAIVSTDSSILIGSDIAVNGTAALEGSFGMQVGVSTGSQLAFVQDDSPSGETIYRASFVINPNDVGINPIPSRLSIFEAFTNTTANNTCQPSCPAFFPAISVYLEYIFPPVGQFQIRPWVWGNQGGAAAAARLPLPVKTGSYRVCFELETGNPGTLRAAVVSLPAACPGTYTTSVNTINSQVAVEFVRLGATGPDNFAPDNSGSFYLDSFESYATLATP